MTPDRLLNLIEEARQSEAFCNYLQVRDRVFDMIEEEQTYVDRPSDYWQQELAGFEYMLDASPLIVQKLREHCYLLTGLYAFDYRGHHSHGSRVFAEKLQALRQQDKDDLLVPESPLLGGFGHVIDDVLINLDTLKFYECLIALNKAGILTPFRRNKGDRKVVMEIGAGWGGFSYQFKTLCPDVTYIIVDLPRTLLFSAVYLTTAFPYASVLIYGDRARASLLQDYQSYDFVFLPHYFMDHIGLSKLDLTINMVSFQEMTSAQVENYVRKVSEMRCPNIYSLNRDRSRYNNQLTAVSSIIARYYELEEVEILDMSYNQVSRGDKDNRRRIIQVAEELARKAFGRSRQRLVFNYRHLLGKLRKAEL